jgi:hypothetical protein
MLAVEFCAGGPGTLLIWVMIAEPIFHIPATGRPAQ